MSVTEEKLEKAVQDLAAENAALKIKACRLEALEEAMRRFPINWIHNEINDLADRIMKERK